MTVESVCVSVSLTRPCYWPGAANMLLFSNKWWVGMVHSRHGVYSCQDNSRAAAGLKFDLHTSAQSAAILVDRKRLWLHFWDSYVSAMCLILGVSPIAETYDVQCMERAPRYTQRGLKYAAVQRHMEGLFVQGGNCDLYLWQIQLEIVNELFLFK